MTIDTYSPLLDNFGATEYDDRHRYNGAEDNMVLPVDLTTRTTSFATDGLVVVTPTDTVIRVGHGSVGLAGQRHVDRSRRRLAVRMDDHQPHRRR